MARLRFGLGFRSQRCTEGGFRLSVLTLGFRSQRCRLIDVDEESPNKLKRAEWRLMKKGRCNSLTRTRLC